MTTHLLDDDGWGIVDGYGRIHVQVLFDATWENVTAYVAGIGIKRGRRRPLDRFDAGTCTVQFDNTTGVFSPWSLATGWGDDGTAWVRPGTPLRVYARTPAGLVKPLFTGWVSSWDEAADNRQGPPVVVANAADGFRRLAAANQVPVTAAGADELTGARIARILDAADWPAAKRRLDPGAVEMQATTHSLRALDELHDTALSEGGALWVDGDGNVVFFDASRLLDQENAQLYTWSNAATLPGLPYVSIDLVADDTAITNVVRIGCSGGSEYTALDTTSVERHGQVAFTRTDLNHRDDADSEVLATVLLSRAAGAEFRIQALEAWPQAAEPDVREDVWDAVVRLDLTDSFTVNYLPDGTSDGFTAQTQIDALEHRIVPEQWVTTYQLSVPSFPSNVTVIAPPYNLGVEWRTGEAIKWSWSNPVGDYDEVLVRIDSGPWTTLAGTREEFTAYGFTPASTHRITVKGRIDGIDSDSIALDTTTLDYPDGPNGDPGDQDGGWVIPDPDDVGEGGCEWRYWLYQLDPESGPAALADGTVPSGAVGTSWRPTYSYTAGNWYRLCFELWCGSPKAKVGERQCDDWEEPSSWTSPCTFDAPPEPTPLFDIEVCGGIGTIQDAVSNFEMGEGPMYFGPYPGPLDGDRVAAMGTGLEPGPWCWNVLPNVVELGTADESGWTIGFWCKLAGEASLPYRIVGIGHTTLPILSVRLIPSASRDATSVEVFAQFADSSFGLIRPDDDPTNSPYLDDVPHDLTWHSVVVSCGWEAALEQAWLRMYLDGVEVAARQIVGEYRLAAHNGYLVCEGAPDSYYGHVVGWDSILSAEDIAAIFTPPPSAPTAPTDWKLYVPCVSNYAKDPASTDSWTPPTITWGTPLTTHPDGQNVAVPSAIGNRDVTGPYRSGAADRETWTWWWFTDGPLYFVEFYRNWNAGAWAWQLRWEYATDKINWSNMTVWGTGWTLAKNAWHHIAVVKTGDATFDLYLDGTLVVSGLTPQVPQPPVDITRLTVGPTKAIARIRRYDYNLTAEQIIAIMQEEGG